MQKPDHGGGSVLASKGGSVFVSVEVHELMALIDIFRVGRARERRLAEQRLTEILDPQP